MIFEDLLESDNILQQYCEFVDDKIKDIPTIPWSQRKSVTKDPGIYFIYDSCNHLIYVGETSNIYNRLSSHEKGNASKLRNKIQDYTKEDALKYLETCNLKTITIKLGRLEVERYLIAKYNPIFNNYKLRKRYNK